MKLNTPALRLSLALILSIISLLFIANLTGLIADEGELALETRKSLSEALALQFAAAAESGQQEIISTTIHEMVERNREIRSAAIRLASGELVAVAGDHMASWRPPIGGKSSPTHVSVPIYRNGARWAAVEISFAPLRSGIPLLGWTATFVNLLCFIGLFGFLCIYIIIRRTLRALDPKAVIPERVQKAFDILQEGVLIMDQQEQILMANKGFATMLQSAPESLLGRKGSELPWVDMPSWEDRRQLPWLQVLENGQDRKGTPLTLRNSSGAKIKLTVNATAVTDSSGSGRGILVTFDDISQLEEKNFELLTTLEKLKYANEEILTKSRELEVLANHDPLTLCLNRRSFSLQCQKLFAEAQTARTPLSCIMVDIDFFKSVNDRYGHATGDHVIKAVADALKSTTRESDLVGRYGGEEFCVLLPGLGIEHGMQIAERIRASVEAQPCSGISITLSLGVSTLSAQVNKPDELINQADKALYAAKNSGRNRVICWGLDVDATIAVPSQGASSRTQNDRSAHAESDMAELRSRIRELEGLLEKRLLEIEHMTMFDTRTGMPTRMLFEDRITREIARSRRQKYLVAVMSMTIDVIKRVHETFGHDVAEQLIRACGHRLNNVLRDNIDTVAVVSNLQEATTVSMLSESEFGILLTDIQQVDHVTRVVRRILDAFDKPFQLMGEDLYASSYVGISIFPTDGEDVKTLYSGATNASHVACSLKTKERYLFCSRDLNERAINHFKIENQLHKAIGNSELHLHYQPKVSAKTGRIIGLEALLRWQNESCCLVSTDMVIHIAEQSGQINDIGDWVIRTVCQQQRIWQDAGLQTVPVAINISGIQLRQTDLPDRINNLLDFFDISADQIEIELTESALINDDELTLQSLKKMADTGLQITIDDFGTGYSALAYLRTLPLSCIKIDRTFVAELDQDNQAGKLIASIVSMAHALNLAVVAEGVEEEYQARHLKNLGCEYLQGYYFGHPVPPEEAAAILQKNMEITQ